MDFTRGCLRAVMLFSLLPAALAVGATVSGTVTLNGGHGDVTWTEVAADGFENPSTHPAADGQYALTGVEPGLRRLIARQLSYDPDTLWITVSEGGCTGADFTLEAQSHPGPSGLSANGNYDDRIHLVWFAPRSLDFGYLIYRDGALVDSVPPTSLSYTDTGLVENVRHTYRVSARYPDEVESPLSDSVTVSCNMWPGAPTNVEATPVGETQMRITWTDPVLNADGTPCRDLAGLQVLRDSVIISQNIAPGVQEFTDVPPDPLRRYNWTVRGFDEVPNYGVGASDTESVQVCWCDTVAEYDWVSISQVGTPIVQCDDCVEGPFELGFTFPFFDHTYTSVRVCSNGYLLFGEPSISFNPACPPSVGAPNSALYVFATDLYPAHGQCRYYADSLNARFIVSWDTAAGWQSSNCFQAILDANGGVYLNYGPISDARCVVGAENEDGMQGFSLWCNDEGYVRPVSHSAIHLWGGPRQAITGVVRHFGGVNPPLPDAQVWVTGGEDTARTDRWGVYTLPVSPGTYTVNFRHATHCDSARQNVVVEPNANTTLNVSLKSDIMQYSTYSISYLCRPGAHEETETFTMWAAAPSDHEGCPVHYSIVDSENWLRFSPDTGTMDPFQTVTITGTLLCDSVPSDSAQTHVWIYTNTHYSPGSILVNALRPDSISPTGNDVSLPKRFALHGNYPNPFNPTTVLPFDVPQTSQVDLIIYNVMGQEVARPVSGIYAAGRYQASFDAKDLPSGLYLVKMTAAGFTAHSKMMMLK